jgi:hypothetical protein
MPNKSANNPDGLRIINTARTLKKINAAATAGLWPLVKPVIPSPEVQEMVAVFQNKVTGEIKLSGDCRSHFGDEYECVMDYTDYYPYHFPEPYAAYLIPTDLQEGERVWLDDVIEDIVAVFGNQGYRPRLDSCEAIWEQGNFRILFDPKKDAEVWIG